LNCWAPLSLINNKRYWKQQPPSKYTATLPAKLYEKKIFNAKVCNEETPTLQT
jgi:hypothetical protein